MYLDQSPRRIETTTREHDMPDDVSGVLRDDGKRAWIIAAQGIDEISHRVSMIAERPAMDISYCTTVVDLLHTKVHDCRP